VIVVVMAVFFYYTEEDDFAGSVTIPIAYISFLLFIVLFSASRRLKKQEQIYLSYKLIITNQSIIREQRNLAPMTIGLNEVKEVKINALGNLEVKGSLPQQLIVVSYFLENFDDIKSQLADRYTLIPKKHNGTLLYYLTIFGVIGIMLAFYSSENHVIIAVTGIILLCILGWGFYKIQISSVINKQAKRSSWWILIVFISIAASIYVRLFLSI
jgi:hypothetical protein